MSIFSFTKAESKMNEALANPSEEWIWVEGVKGMDKDMQCRGYQFEIGRQEDMPEGEKIIDCRSGFHFCLNLADVFEYYDIGNGHRFFRVKGLVRKKDFDEYVDPYKLTPTRSSEWALKPWRRDKLAAKSIVPLYELTPDQIFSGTKEANWPLEDKIFALENGKAAVQDRVDMRELISLGYSETFAYYLVTKCHDKLEVAKTVGSLTELSMDMKVLCILSGKLETKEGFAKMLASIAASSIPAYTAANAINYQLQKSIYKLAED